MIDADEEERICYSHADNASLTKLQSFQEYTLRQLGLAGFSIDSMTTRRKVAYTSMLYKQVVLGEGPGFIRANFPVKAPSPCSHLSSPATERHMYQLSITSTASGPGTSQRCKDFVRPLLEWNSLPPSTVAGEASLHEFKRRVAAHFRNIDTI